MNYIEELLADIESGSTLDDPRKRQLIAHYLKEVSKLRATVERVTEYHRRNIEQSGKWTRDQHHCDWRVRCEATVERARAALQQEETK